MNGCESNRWLNVQKDKQTNNNSESTANNALTKICLNKMMILKITINSSSVFYQPQEDDAKNSE